MVLRFKEHYQAVIFRGDNALSSKWKVKQLDKLWVLQKGNGEYFKCNNLNNYEHSPCWFPNR